MRTDPYRVLGVPSGASLDEAEDAYHRLLRQEHPDLHHTAGPERVAHAETRTRELNGAISAIRDAEALRWGAASGGGGDDRSTGAGGTTTGTGDGTAGHGDWTTGHADADAAWQAPAEPPRSTAPCPWCGERFERATELKDHVFADHDLRLDRRVRGGLFGGRIHRWLRAAAHLPLWGVVPVNLALALVIAILVAIPTNVTLGRCVFVLAMAPTAVALVDRFFDLSG